MVMQNEWKERGHRAVGAAADLASGLFRGVQNIGPRIQAAQYRPIVEAFCAYTGLMAAQHGRLQRTEIDGFRNFLLQNRQHPVFGGFPLDELIDKFKNYAVKAFLEETEIFSSVLNPIPPNSDEAQLIVAGCLSVIFADGHCDANERVQLDQLARRLNVDTALMARNMGVSLPDSSASGAMTPPVLPPVMASPQAAPSRGSAFSQAAASISVPTAQSGSGREMCTFCQGKGCVFCNETGFKS